MLTADLVRASVKGGKLHLRPLSGKTKTRALELAASYFRIASDYVGKTREELEEAWELVALGPQEKKLGAGIQKLIEDDCDFGSESPVEPRALRGEVFSAASEAWKRHPHAEPFPRQRVLTAVAQKFEMDPATVEAALYADLRGAEKLNRLGASNAERLVERYDRAQIQAVLLRAVSVRAVVRCPSADAYRNLFRQLKFRRLLYRIQEQADGTYAIDIDGPYSLFDNVTKYGLQLALVLPALERASHLRLTAEVRWGKARQPAVLEWESRGSERAIEAESRLSDDLVELIAGFHALDSGWKVAAATELVSLPGSGLCVPDLVFTSPEGTEVLFELLGFWSRDAVWKRVELVQTGLRARMLFAVSSRLRVSEAVLEDDDRAALYVYKGVLSPRVVLKKLEGLAAERH